MYRADARQELAQLRRIFAGLNARGRAGGSNAIVTFDQDIALRLVDDAIGRVESGRSVSSAIESLTTRELATKWRKSEWTIRDYAKRGRIPGAHKVGRDWLFPLGTELLPSPDTHEERSADELVVAIDAYLESI